ncbi:hypothetical protein HID58_003473 [Brassica napus]|uniref:Uncharacterized protein n=1 Tax=Brassica napus TaxID=3708 RepID=A0ABQ8ETA3_BRANA|nr:hypothetical protein HID58_003473 [Brassica napus]
MLRSCFDQFRSCFDQFRSAHHRLYSLSTVSFILRFFVTKFEATISCICNHDVKKPSTQKSFDSLRKHSKHMPHLSCEESGGLWSVRSSDSNASASVLAVALKRRGKCTLRLPAWLSVRSLVEDIRDMPNVSAMEVNLVRLFVRRALEEFYKHDKTEADADADTRRSSRQPREANNEPRTSKATLRSFEIFCANSCGAPWELRTSTVSTSVSSYLPCFSCSVTYSDIYLASLYL